MFPTILIVDDEPSIVQSLSGLLSDEGFEVLTAANGYEALQIIESESPDLVVLDIWMPGIDGIETLKEIKKSNPNLQVIMVTGHGTIETAINATKIGAFDFIEKPLSIDKLIVSINNALNFRKLEEENKYLRKKTLEKNSICGSSPAILSLKQQIVVAAPTESWILIKGENGTGKELVARNIQQLSPRSDKPFIAVNCATIPDDVIESELFGHEKGAFPGALSKSIGKFELANTGTLFLDEICDMSLKTQAKILRVLQEQKFQRLGGSRYIGADVRVIASTNKNIEKEIEKGNFREDLYFRLNVIPIEVPALRNRKEDIPVLFEHFIKEISKQNGTKTKSVTKEVLEILAEYLWPGNVRELKNLIERLMIMVPKNVIEKNDIPAPYNPIALNITKEGEGEFFLFSRLKDARKAFEKEFITRKLLQNKNNITTTAEAIGVELNYLYKKLKQLNWFD
ncbi:MAG: sigma-54-dependent Fis family transcriptional regulator [Desulfobacterales bacterium]|nr:sigma-54-dependent Fis family transcriptional regulator [Desulfobacterales bacterium]